MPVFGKGRKGRERTKFIGKEKGYGNVYRRREWYPFTGTSAMRVKIHFSKIFGKNDFIRERFEKTGKPVVVLDWGCGKGKAIAGLAKEHGPKIRAYGFSKDSYKKWLKINNVKFIHNTAENLLRYLKNDSVDLVYSYVGLTHMFPGTLKAKWGLERLEGTVQYIERLLKKVSKGGKIAFNKPLFKKMRAQTKSALENALKDKADIEFDWGTIYITKK